MTLLIERQFERIIELEKNEMLRAFNEDLLPPVIAIAKIDLLMSNVHLNGQKLKPIKGLRKGNGYIWYYNGVASCWVNANYTGYRNAYKKFLKQEFNKNIVLPIKYDIDHLFNQRRGDKYDSGYLRIFPILKNINRGHGASFEKRVTKSELFRPMKIMHFMTFISVLKLMGIIPPNNVENIDEIERISEIVSDTGFWSKYEVKSSLVNLINRLNNSSNIIVSQVNIKKE